MERFEDKNQDMENDNILSLRDVAEILEVSTNVVRELAITGELQSLPVGPDGELRFRVNEVAAFLTEENKRDLGKEKSRDDSDEEEERHKLELEYFISTFEVHADEAKPLVMEELIPYEYKYTELSTNPRPESRFFIRYK